MKYWKRYIYPDPDIGIQVGQDHIDRILADPWPGTLLIDLPKLKVLLYGPTGDLYIYYRRRP